MALFSELAKGTGEGWNGNLKVGVTAQEIQVRCIIIITGCRNHEMYIPLLYKCLAPNVID